MADLQGSGKINVCMAQNPAKYADLAKLKACSVRTSEPNLGTTTNGIAFANGYVKETYDTFNAKAVVAGPEVKQLFDNIISESAKLGKGSPKILSSLEMDLVGIFCDKYLKHKISFGSVVFNLPTIPASGEFDKADLSQMKKDWPKYVETYKQRAYNIERSQRFSLMP